MSVFAVRVLVLLRPGVRDPQGQAISAALSGIGIEGVSEVRAGKVFDLAIAATDAAEAKERAEAAARRLLANPVLETFAVEVDGS